MFNFFKKKKESKQPEPSVDFTLKSDWLNDFIFKNYGDKIKICAPDHYSREAILVYKNIPFANVSSNYIPTTNFKTFRFSYSLVYYKDLMKQDTTKWIKSGGYFHSAYSEETVEELKVKLSEIMKMIDEGLKFKEIEKAKYLYLKGMK